MSTPLVSIITPSYNQGAFIGETIRSVLSQDYPALELIVMDGGSTDSTVEVLRSFDDPRLTWVSEKDRGQSDAINKGLRRAKGEILTYLNSDDLLLPGAVRFTVDYFNAHPEVDIFLGDVSLVDAVGNPVGSILGAPFDLAQALKGGLEWPQPGTFWRQKVSKGIGGFDIHLHYRMDSDFWLRAALEGMPPQYLPGIRAAYRLHEQSKTVSQSQKFIHDWQVIIERIFARADLAAEYQALRDDAFAHLRWQYAKLDWLHKDYAKSRPTLWSFAKDRWLGRRVLAATMLMDSYLGTPLTRLLAALYFRLRGKKLLIE